MSLHHIPQGQILSCSIPLNTRATHRAYNRDECLSQAPPHRQLQAPPHIVPSIFAAHHKYWYKPENRQDTSFEDTFAQKIAYPVRVVRSHSSQGDNNRD